MSGWKAKVCRECGGALVQPAHGGRPRIYCDKPVCQRWAVRIRRYGWRRPYGWESPEQRKVRELREALAAAVREAQASN